MLLSREGEEIRGRAASPQKLGLHFHQSSTEKAPPALAALGSPGSTQQGPERGAELRGRDGPSSLAAQHRVGMPKAGLCLQTGFKEDGEKRDTV